jgi:hypothetical protein
MSYFLDIKICFCDWYVNGNPVNQVDGHENFDLQLFSLTETYEEYKLSGTSFYSSFHLFYDS